MKHPFLCALALAAGCGTAQAQTLAPARNTVELNATHSNLSNNLQQGESLGLRGTWLLDGGHVARAELLGERKFGRHGGVLAGSYTRVLSPDWFATGTLAAGQGGPNWATWRVDAQLSRKWLAERQLVTSAALYYALFKRDGSDAFAQHVVDTVIYDTPSNPITRYRVLQADRSDRGLRLSAAWYLPLPGVLEAGVTFNLSRPGNVNSYMPFVSATLGREGEQYVSARLASGTEAYQALGSNVTLVDFRSDSASLSWRRWLGPRWGFTAQAEAYRNPTYRRQTFGLGMFAQWE